MRRLRSPTNPAGTTFPFFVLFKMLKSTPQKGIVTNPDFHFEFVHTGRIIVIRLRLSAR